MIFEEHPLVSRDIDEIAFFIYQTAGSRDAAIRRLQEVDALRRDVISNPLSGVRLDGRLTGCLVRHGGRDNRLTIIWRPEPEHNRTRILMVAFGGRDWMGQAPERI